jgi:heme a synthase
MGLGRTKIHPWLDRYAIFVALCTFLLVIAGALATSNVEGHRAVGGFDGLLTVVLAIWIWAREPRSWLRKLGGVAVLVVLAQAGLGAITVDSNFPVLIAVAHACLGQVFFCITVSLAILVGPGWKWDEPKLEDASKPSARHLAVWAAGAIFLQVMLGAAFRHGGMDLGPHLATTLVVAVLAVWLAKRILAEYAHSARLVRSVLLLGGLVVLQLVLGVGSYMEMLNFSGNSEPPAVTASTIHVVAGALVLAAAVVMVLQAYRGLSGLPAAAK